MSASTSRKRKNQPVEKPSGPRPSVFDRLGTKANQQQADARTNFCHHWKNTGNCPFGATCKNANFHALISPSKRVKGSEKDHQLSKESNNRKDGGRNKKGKGKEPWCELDEGELERRRLQLQKELDLQNRQEMKKKPAKKQKRSSSSSSTSSTHSSSNTSKNSSAKSSQPRARKPRSRKKKPKARGQAGVPIKPIQEIEAKSRMRENPKDNKKRSMSSGRQDHRSRSKHRPAAASSSAPKKRRNSTSSENSSAERRRQQSKNSSHLSKGKGRSPSPEKKKKQVPASYDRKSPVRRRESPVNQRRNSPNRNRKRSVSPGPPRPRRRTPSPRAKIDKKHESRVISPAGRHRSVSQDKKESRRGPSPPSPHDRGHPKPGRNSRRNSPDPAHRGQPRDSRNRPPVSRSPDRRNRAVSREPRDSGDKRDFARRDYNSPVAARAHLSSRVSPDNAVRPSSRDRRDEPSRDKNRSNKESERDRRRDGGPDKGRDRGRGRDEELPSLLTMMTQHPAQYSPRRGRDEPPEHRAPARERGRYERYEERGEPSFAHADEHPRPAKRPARRESPPRPRPERSQKGGRDWTEHPDQREKDWDRRGKGGGNAGHRDWEEQPRGQMRGGKGGGGGHRRGPSPPVAASPKPPRDPVEHKESHVVETKPEEEKKIEKVVVEEVQSGEPVAKKICLEGDESSLGPMGGALDKAESDFSDFSDDDDDILNADVAEEEAADLAKAEDKADVGFADEKDDDEPVEDMLEDMDFEEISDGELDAEDIKAGADALSVDWAALLNQTRQEKREESESFVNRWDIGRVLSKIGVPMCLKGTFDLKPLGLEYKENGYEVKSEQNKMRMSFLIEDDTLIQDEVPGIHAAIVKRKKDIANILNPNHHRGIDFDFGEQLRKLCPFESNLDPSAKKEMGAAPYLKQLAVDFFKGNMNLQQVQQRLNLDVNDAVKIES